MQTNDTAPRADSTLLTKADMEMISRPLFMGFPKLARLSRECVVTEKLDGTNAAVVITEDGRIFAQSRTRFITPEADNFGFAAWVRDNAAELLKLGEGRHFGEWWGSGIQRRYGLTARRFSLFNTARWIDPHGVDNPGAVQWAEGRGFAPACCHVVPVIWRGIFDTAAMDRALALLGSCGSYAAPGFMKPEGIVVYHTASGGYFKKTLDNDAQPKSLAASPPVII